MNEEAEALWGLILDLQRRVEALEAESERRFTAFIYPEPPEVMSDISDIEHMLVMPIAELEFDGHAAKCMYEAYNIRYIWQLVVKTLGELEKVPRVGTSATSRLQRRLAAFSQGRLCLGMRFSEEVRESLRMDTEG